MTYWGGDGGGVCNCKTFQDFHAPSSPGKIKAWGWEERLKHGVGGKKGMFSCSWTDATVFPKARWFLGGLEGVTKSNNLFFMQKDQITRTGLG